MSALSRLAGPPVRAWYDPDCGICTAAMRLGRRLDLLKKIEFIGTDGPPPPGLMPEAFLALRQDTLIVALPDGPLLTRHRAVARLMRALPLGALVAWVLVVPGLERLFGWGYDWVARHRSAISRCLGLTVCRR